MRDDKVRGAHFAVMIFVATQWQTLCLNTFASAFAKEHLEDITAGAESVEEANEWLLELFNFAIATVKRFSEFQLLYLAYPWRFCLLLDPAFRQSTLDDMAKEWTFLLKMEERHAQDLKKYPFCLMPHLRWHCYREIMTFCAERSWKFSKDVFDLVAAWFPEVVSTLGADAVFRCMRDAERDTCKNGETSPIQLQSVAIKALDGRYDSFETPKLNQHDYAGIAPGTFVKRSVFDSSRASASDTNVPNFNAMCKAETMSPHMITRKCLNLWRTLMQTEGLFHFGFNSFFCGVLFVKQNNFSPTPSIREPCHYWHLHMPCRRLVPFLVSSTAEKRNGAMALALGSGGLES